MSPHENAIFDMARAGLSPYYLERILDELPAIQRAHEAACNWPEETAAPFVKAGGLAFARIERLLEDRATLPGRKFRATRQTDPRGCCVELWSDESDKHPCARLSATGFTTSQIERIDRY